MSTDLEVTGPQRNDCGLPFCFAFSEGRFYPEPDTHSWADES
jgi:hypothetical protein